MFVNGLKNCTALKNKKKTMKNSGTNDLMSEELTV